MGRKQTKSGKIRLTEVAKLAGVSPITASRFFRNPEALSLSKRERVDSAVKAHMLGLALKSSRARSRGETADAETLEAELSTLEGVA